MPITAQNPLRLDPSRTLGLRRRFEADLRRRLARIRAAVVQLVDVEDSFGLRDNPLARNEDGRIRLGGTDSLLGRSNNLLLLDGLSVRSPVVNTGQWRFLTMPEQVRAFSSWLRSQLGREFSGADEEAVWRRYVEEGFRRGAGRAFDDARRGGKALRDQSVAFLGGAREQFIRLTMAAPVAVEKVKLIAGRVFTSLQGVTEIMATQMTRVLADGLVRGESPRQVARDLVKQVDGIGRRRAEMVAQTEIMSAHAEGQLHALEELGVEELGVLVEWTTAGFRVCPRCEAMSGKVFKVKDSHGLIPSHPLCRCVWIPAGVGERRAKPGIVPQPKPLLEKVKAKTKPAAPEVKTGSKRQVDRAIQEGAVEVYRGIPDAAAAKRVRQGQHFVGQGDYGEGAYFATSRYEAELYAAGESGKARGGVIRAAILPEAKVIDASELVRRQMAEGDQGDMGHYAKRLGYDVIRVPHKGYYTVINPDAILVQKTAPRRK